MTGGTGVEMLSALAIVLATIVGLRFALRALGLAPSVAGRRMRVVESLALGAKQRLLLVEVEGERLLLATGDGPARLVRRLPREATAARESDAAAERALASDEACAGPGRDAVPASVPSRALPAHAATTASAHALRARVWLRALGIGAGVLALVAGLASIAHAAEPGAAAAAGARVGADLAGQIDALTQPDRISSTLEIVALLTAVSVAPSILLMATCFTRILIVFSFLRQAVGVPQLPPNQILAALALFTTLFVMAPVGTRIQQEALEPYLAREIEPREALGRAATPVREFLLAHTRDRDLALFVEMSGQTAPAKPEEVTLSTLLPAYMISELRTAFEIGFMIYLPFLVIDIVIASLLISMGMIVLPPIVISLPFKLMLFVLLDGWNLVLSSLVTGLR